MKTSYQDFDISSHYARSKRSWPVFHKLWNSISDGTERKKFSTSINLDLPIEFY